MTRLHTLETLRVWNCYSLEEIFEFQALGDQKTYDIIAPQLREIELVQLPKLKHVWNMNAQQILALETLINIRVSNCRGLKSLFSAFIAKGLCELEELEITGGYMNEIVGKQERAVEEAIIPRFKFPRLSSLELSRMPFLETFYSKEHISEWPALKKMKLFGCSEIKILSSELQCHQESQLNHLQALFFIDEVAFPSLKELEVCDMDALLHLLTGNSQPFQSLENLKVTNCQRLKNLGSSTMSLRNLRTLEVSKCNELIDLVTLSTARSLVKITRMDIIHCQMIEEIITQEEDEGINDEIVFKELKCLELVCLPRLRGFYLGNYTLELPSLDEVGVGECSQMEIFSRGFVNSPKLQGVKLIRGEEEEETDRETEEVTDRGDEEETDRETEEETDRETEEETDRGDEEETDSGDEEETEGEEEEETDREYEWFWEGDRVYEWFWEGDRVYEWFWEGDLNTTIQLIFKKLNAKAFEQDYVCVYFVTECQDF